MGTSFIPGLKILNPLEAKLAIGWAVPLVHRIRKQHEEREENDGTRQPHDMLTDVVQQLV